MNLEVFKFEGVSVRTWIDEDKNPWFVAKDIFATLDISRPRDALMKIKDKYKRRLYVDASNETLISEPAVYRTILVSRKPSAEKFQDWIVEDVLPQIRKTGAYSTGANWLEARNEGKAVRKLTTDIIKIFVDYAKGQGSESADKYFMNFSKMVNTALLEIEGQKPSNLRDHLNVIQLHQLSVAEHIVSKSIVECIGRGLPYKEVYQLAKQKIQVYSATIGRSKLGASERQIVGLLGAG